jgi:hypothetical protein
MAQEGCFQILNINGAKPFRLKNAPLIVPNNVEQVSFPPPPPFVDHGQCEANVVPGQTADSNSRRPDLDTLLTPSEKRIPYPPVKPPESGQGFQTVMRAETVWCVHEGEKWRGVTLIIGASGAGF